MRIVLTVLRNGTLHDLTDSERIVIVRSLLNYKNELKGIQTDDPVKEQWTKNEIKDAQSLLDMIWE